MRWDLVIERNVENYKIYISYFDTLVPQQRKKEPFGPRSRIELSRAESPDELETF